MVCLIFQDLLFCPDFTVHAKRTGPVSKLKDSTLIEVARQTEQRRCIHYYYNYYFNFLQTVAHSAELVCKGPSIYKVKAQILQKKVHIFIKSKLKSVYN